MFSRLKQTHWKLQATGGFSLIEIVIVIMAIGIFGSLAATMLANGATIYAETMEKKRFIAQARSSYWRLNRETGLQQKKSNYINSTQNMVNIATATGKTVQATLTGETNLNLSISGSSHLLSNTTLNDSSRFSYLTDQFNEISIPAGQSLTQSQSQNVHLMQIDIKYQSSGATIRFKSFVFPQNVRFGQEMPYHE